MNPQYARQKQYKQMLVARGICIECIDFNDSQHSRCTRCRRRAYVLKRIKQVLRATKYYKHELRLLLQEDREWRREKVRKHSKTLELSTPRGQWRRTGRGVNFRDLSGRLAA